MSGKRCLLVEKSVIFFLLSLVWIVMGLKCCWFFSLFLKFLCLLFVIVMSVDKWDRVLFKLLVFLGVIFKLKIGWFFVNNMLFLLKMSFWLGVIGSILIWLLLDWVW